MKKLILILMLGCSLGAFAQGGAGLPSDLCALIPDAHGSSYLLLKLGPCPVGTKQLLTYTSSKRMYAQLIHAWIGTPPGQLFETISRLQIETPDGRFYEFFSEYDKHSTVDDSGKFHMQFNVRLFLPAGTRFTVTREFGGLLLCPAQGGPWPDGCLTEIHWRIYGL
jgi:hypothetical protein